MQYVWPVILLDVPLRLEPHPTRFSDAVRASRFRCFYGIIGLVFVSSFCLERSGEGAWGKCFGR